MRRTPEKPDLPLITTRLIIRRFVPADWRDLLDYFSSPEVATYEYWEPRDERQVKDFIRSLQDAGSSMEGQWQGFAMEHRHLGKVIGDLGILVTSREHGQGEISFKLNPAYQRQGFATEGARALLRYGFQTLDLHRIVANCDPRNTRSYRLMERLGMRREAHLRESVFSKGEWCDELIYALLQREWRQSQQAGARR